MIEAVKSVTGHSNACIDPQLLLEALGHKLGASNSLKGSTFNSADSILPIRTLHDSVRAGSVAGSLLQQTVGATEDRRGLTDRVPMPSVDRPPELASTGNQFFEQAGQPQRIQGVEPHIHNSNNIYTVRPPPGLGFP